MQKKKKHIFYILKDKKNIIKNLKLFCCKDFRYDC